MWAAALFVAICHFQTTIERVPIPLRPVRVLVGDGLAQASIRTAGTLTIHPSPKAGQPRTGNQILVRAAPDGLQVDQQAWPKNDISIEAADGSLVLVIESESEGQVEKTFPGRLRIISSDQLQIINEVDLEDYVSSVVASEVWPSFETEAFRAQSIVTRTYVLYHMLRRTNTLYDVAATQGSQVYRGLRTDSVGIRAREAAEYTSGLVCVWRDPAEQKDRIFCTYYSAACGGMSQPAAPLGAEGDIPPLSGGVRCDFCRDAPGQTYRWGPVRISSKEVQARLLERYPEMTELRSMRSIKPAELTRFGRPLTWRISGSSGATRDILAERFRLAVAPNVIKSTDCNVRVDGPDFVFEDGKGFGHGLGLCQWGMQGQAQAGKDAAEILRYYFPGSRLIRVY